MKWAIVGWERENIWGGGRRAVLYIGGVRHSFLWGAISPTKGTYTGGGLSGFSQSILIFLLYFVKTFFLIIN